MTRKTSDRAAGSRRQEQSKAERDFCKRVRYLIDRYDEGNVAAAARRLGVSQRGLAKVYVGETTTPRLTLVQAVVGGYRSEDPLWIVLGIESRASEQISTQAQAIAKNLLHEMIGRVAGPERGKPGSAHPTSHRT